LIVVTFGVIYRHYGIFFIKFIDEKYCCSVKNLGNQIQVSLYIFVIISFCVPQPNVQWSTRDAQPSAAPEWQPSTATAAWWCGQGPATKHHGRRHCFRTLSPRGCCGGGGGCCGRSGRDQQQAAEQEAQRRAARRTGGSGAARVGRLHLSGRGRVCRVGGLDVHRRRVLLLRHAVHDRVRRPGTGQVVPGHRHSKRTAAAGRVLRLPAVRPGPDRHVVLARPGGGGVQVPARRPLRGPTQTAAQARHPAVRLVIRHPRTARLQPSSSTRIYQPFSLRISKTKIVRHVQNIIHASR